MGEGRSQAVMELGQPWEPSRSCKEEWPYRLGLRCQAFTPHHCWALDLVVPERPCPWVMRPLWRGRWGPAMCPAALPWSVTVTWVRERLSLGGGLGLTWEKTSWCRSVATKSPRRGSEVLEGMSFGVQEDMAHSFWEGSGTKAGPAALRTPLEGLACRPLPTPLVSPPGH